MKKYVYLLVSVIVAPIVLWSQLYKASLIPDSLKENANAVVRFEELHIQIESIDKAVIKHKRVVTILNEEGEGFARYDNSYSKLISLSDISGYLYDAEGKLIRKIKKKDISDVTGTDDNTLLTDRRIKTFAFYNKQFPYTVEYEDEQVFNGIFYLPIWTPFDDEKLAIQESKFTIETPDYYKLRYKQLNYPDKEPIVTKKDKIVQYHWQINNQKYFEGEVYAPNYFDLVPVVVIAPTQFLIDGFHGDMSTWNGFGKFIAALNNGRNQLPESIKNEVHQLTDKLTSIEEKVKVLYEYLQKNTRYISIQLGVGSWQPLEANFVAQKKFGDCKALSNFMVSLLQEASVPANYVIINSGRKRKDLWEDFPAPFFNHVVMCVPNGKDTIWLECTSQTESVGFMGVSTANRKAVMLTPEGATIVNTPSLGKKENIQLRVVNATIDNQGNLKADVLTKFTGLQQELQHSLLHYATKEERDKYLNRVLNLPTYKVENIEYQEKKGRVPEMIEHLTITSANYATITGKRLFITPNLFNKEAKLPTDKPRKYDIHFDFDYSDIDTIKFVIQPGYTVESMPKDVSITNKFGNYSISYTVNGENIQLIRKQERIGRHFPASDYEALVDYYNQMAKADRARIILVKKAD
ncbi:MAG: DUF3857 domain-containing protein [Chitinophagaceae bacterium]